MNFSIRKLDKWMFDVVVANTTFHETRKRLWDQFMAAKVSLSAGAGVEQKSEAKALFLSLPLILKLKNFLTSRSDDLTPSARLAFDAAIQELSKLMTPDDELSEDLNSSLKLTTHKVLGEKSTPPSPVKAKEQELELPPDDV